MFYLTTMALNDLLFQVCYACSSCLVWHVVEGVSQASVQGMLLAVVLVDGCFLLLCTVSSVTGQCEAFSHGLQAVKPGSIVATPWAACLSSSPLTDEPVCFPFPWSGRANWIPVWFPELSSPPGVHMRNSWPFAFYWELLVGRRGLFL